jgi:hypothetical protein
MTDTQKTQWRRIGVESAAIVATEEENWQSEQISIDLAILTLLSPTTIDFGSSSLDAVVNAGRLEIISNKKLRGKLSGWKAVLDEVRAEENYGDWPVATSSIADDSALMSHFLTDAEFKALLENRYGSIYHTIEEYDAAIQAANDILQEISGIGR